MANVKTYSQTLNDMISFVPSIGEMDIDRFKKTVIMALRSYRAAFKRKTRPAEELNIMHQNCMMMLEVAYDVIRFQVKK